MPVLVAATFAETHTHAQKLAALRPQLGNFATVVRPGNGRSESAPHACCAIYEKVNGEMWEDAENMTMVPPAEVESAISSGGCAESRNRPARFC